MKPKIGSRVFLVNKAWKRQKSREGARVVPARVTGYVNHLGKVIPEFRVGKLEYHLANNDMYLELEDAIEAIR